MSSPDEPRETHAKGCALFTRTLVCDCGLDERRARETTGWQPLSTAPDGPQLYAHFTGDRLEWAESGRRGKGACRVLFYSLHGRSIYPTHWMPLPVASLPAPTPRLSETTRDG